MYDPILKRGACPGVGTPEETLENGLRAVAFHRPPPPGARGFLKLKLNEGKLPLNPLSSKHHHEQTPK